MAAKNDITGDSIQSRSSNSKEFQSNWDNIFGKKKGCAVCGKKIGETAYEHETLGKLCYACELKNS